MIDKTSGNIVAGSAYNVLDGGTDTYREGTGKYKVTFNNAMPHANYVVSLTALNNSTSSSTECSTISLGSSQGSRDAQTTHFFVNMRGANGANLVNAGFHFVVYCLDS